MALLAVLTLLLAGCPAQHSGAARRIDLTGEQNPAIQLSAEEDHVFVPFSGQYPADWPAHLRVLDGTLLNHGGGIALAAANSFGMTSTAYIAKGVMPGAADAVLHELLGRATAPYTSGAANEQDTPTSYAKTIAIDDERATLRTFSSTAQPGYAMFTITVLPGGAGTVR